MNEIVATSKGSHSVFFITCLYVHNIRYRAVVPKVEAASTELRVTKYIQDVKTEFDGDSDTMLARKTKQLQINMKYQIKQY